MHLILCLWTVLLEPLPLQHIKAWTSWHIFFFYAVSEQRNTHNKVSYFGSLHWSCLNTHYLSSWVCQIKELLLLSVARWRGWMGPSSWEKFIGYTQTVIKTYTGDVYPQRKVVLWSLREVGGCSFKAFGKPTFDNSEHQKVICGQ